MAFAGMDLEAVLRHASALEHQAANEVAVVLTALTGMMPELMQNWHGEDARRFEQEWNEHRSNLLNLHSELNGLVGSLNRSITQQQHASEG